MATKKPSKTIRSRSRYYDAAETDSNEVDFGAYLATLPEDFYFNTSTRAVVISRLRRHVRNNPYLAGLVNKYPEAVGTSNLRSRTSDRKYNAKKELFWFRYKKSVTNAGDSLRALERLILIELLIAGEIFLVLLANGKVQAIPSEFCGSPSSANPLQPLSGGEVNGITYADNGLPIGYRFGKMTSGGLIDYANGAVINARFVIHIFDKDRVLMGRGLPTLISCLRPAQDLYEIVRSKTKQIKDANMICGTIEKANADAFLAGLDAGPAGSSKEPEKPTDSAEKPTAGPIVVELRPGTLIALEPGEKVTSLMSQYNASDYKELIMLMLHAISSPVGLPVELWFSGLGDVNYSGFKGLGTQWNARRRYVIQFLEDRYLNRLQFWRISKAANEGDLPPNPDNDDDLIDWAWRRTSVLDEEKEAKANAAKLASGQSSLADIWEQEGLYADEVFEHRRQLWIQLQIAARKLSPDVDPDTVEVPEIFLLRGLLPGEGKAAQPADPQANPDPASAPQPAKAAA